MTAGRDEKKQKSRKWHSGEFTRPMLLHFKARCNRNAAPPVYWHAYDIPSHFSAICVRRGKFHLSAFRQGCAGRPDRHALRSLRGVFCFVAMLFCCFPSRFFLGVARKIVVFRSNLMFRCFGRWHVFFSRVLHTRCT